MKKGNTKMSVSAQSFLGKIVLGLLWIGVGITNIFDDLAMIIIHALLLVSTIIVLVVLLRANCEKDDEMSDYNYMQAKAKTRDLMHCVYAGIAVIVPFAVYLLHNDNIFRTQTISALFFILMGVQDLITGIMFRRLEAE